MGIINKEAYRNRSVYRPSQVTVDKSDPVNKKFFSQDVIQKASDESISMTNEEIIQLQHTLGNEGVSQLLSSNSKVNKSNNTGLPDNLKSGIENLSGISMDDVRVHYNSSKPKELNAVAYTQGTDIHIGKGQERFLPHEAWHVIQQKKGLVNPTTNINNIKVNDDKDLELEADNMGSKALSLQSNSINSDVVKLNKLETSTASSVSQGSGIVQRHIYYDSTVPEFQVDGKRPSFIGAVKAMVILASQSRDHIVPFDAIQNDLAIILNNILSANMTVNDLVNFTEALFPNKGTSSYKQMEKRRNKLVTSINNTTTLNYQKDARALLVALNSSSDNIRAGDSTKNSSIQENLDADFLPGVQTVPVGGLSVRGNAGLQTLPSGTKYLRLEPKSEAVLYEYQKQTTQNLSFVLDQGTNTQMSSYIEPQQVLVTEPVSGRNVIVFDPTGIGTPFFYS